ncbi:MAG: hypothetical protein RIB60_00970 [Phycisphaerales bacterium]
MSDVRPVGGESAIGRVEARRSADRPGVEAEPARRRGSDRVEVSDQAHLLNKLRATDAARDRLSAPDGAPDLDHLAKLLARLRGIEGVEDTRIDEIRQQIDDGSYLTDDKIEGAIDALLNDIRS